MIPEVTPVPLIPSSQGILKVKDAAKEPTLSRRQKAKAIAEPEERLQRTVFVGNLPVDVCKSKVWRYGLKMITSICRLFNDH